MKKKLLVGYFCFSEKVEHMLEWFSYWSESQLLDYPSFYNTQEEKVALTHLFEKKQQKKTPEHLAILSKLCTSSATALLQKFLLLRSLLRTPYGLTTGRRARKCRWLCWIEVLCFGLTAGGVTSKTEGTVAGCRLAFNGKHIGNVTLSFPCILSSVPGMWGELMWKVGTTEREIQSCSGLDPKERKEELSVFLEPQRILLLPPTPLCHRGSFAEEHCLWSEFLKYLDPEKREKKEN